MVKRRRTVMVLSSESEYAIYHDLKEALEDGGFDVRLRLEGSHKLSYSLQLLEADLSNIEFVIVIWTSGHAADGAGQRASSKIAFEIGYFIGALGADRVLILTTENNLHFVDFHEVAFQQVSDPMPRAYALDLATQVKNALKLLGTRRSTESPPYYSCFLSYSAQDTGFVRKLVSDLSNAGVDCWLDTKDISAGAPIEREIRRGLSRQDKLLLVLSQSSARSRWVESELRLALSLERERGSEVIFPLRLDDSVFSSPSPLLANLAKTRHISDFEGWQDEDEYHRRLRHLVRDLTISAASDLERDA
jgi:hypothetical protein